MSVVFISGPMRGYHNFNHEAFNQKSAEFRKEGHIVLNPASLPLGLEHEAYMKLCIPMVEIADTVYFLYGWQASHGAREEFNHAVRLGKRLEFEEAIDYKHLIEG